MSVNSINNSYASAVASEPTRTSSNAKSSAKADTTADSTGVIYEKSSSSQTQESKKSQQASVVAQLKADANKRAEQLTSIVRQMMSKQGNAIGNADDMWSFLASGKYTVSADVKAQAQKDIAEDGYWGVSQTSDRILDFAKALSGGDKSKAEELLEAFKKGFKQATKSWGKALPDISQRTYDAVVDKFDTWMNEED
ncbi:MAG: hypothetical protein K2O73_01745 [Lachnospiraceae bacterium]|nr:hypothetical protein [Lachnospiraceae bacterium]